MILITYKTTPTLKITFYKAHKKVHYSKDRIIREALKLMSQICGRHNCPWTIDPPDKKIQILAKLFHVGCQVKG